MSTLLKVDHPSTGIYDTEIVEHWLHAPFTHVPAEEKAQPRPEKQRTLAIVSFEEPGTVIGQYINNLADALAKWRTNVHIFVRESVNLDIPGVHIHAVGNPAGDNLLEQVEQFTRLASNAFLREFDDCRNLMLMGFEWSAIPTISLLHGIKNLGMILSLHSLERQRSYMAGELSRSIEEIELSGLREARLILTHDPVTAEIAGRCVPECDQRILVTNPMTVIQNFLFDLDPGEVKKRFQVGPTDPTILFIGDLHENYGPDLLMKTMPMILKDQNQTRCVFVGDGELLWPLRVYSRYLLLDHAVRMAGSLEGRTLYELIYAADVIVVPSRKSTPWWPIEAAWAAKRPVVATYEAAPALVRHEHDCLLTETNEKSLASGIQRVLGDPDFAAAIAGRGRAKLEERYSVNKVVSRIEELMGVREAVEQHPDFVQT